MFQVISLGHHGWIFRTQQATLAVDPMLGPRFGFTRELRVWPERTLALDRFPRLDALFLTHEHEGHFDPLTLSLLPRDTPVWIPSRSSSAMQTAIEEMGFVVRRARAGVPIVVGDLELFPMAADQVRATIEEWDVLAYTVRDLSGHGSFFTHVDVSPNDRMREHVVARLGRPVLWAVTANEHEYPFQTSWRTADRSRAAEIASHLISDYRWLEARGAAPEGLLLVGGGWAFEGSLGWLNHNAFPVDPDAVVGAVAALLPEVRVARPRPGDAWTCVGGALARVEAPDVGIHPARATDRSYRGDVEWLEEYGPACGRTALDAAELGTLREELDRLAAALYGGPTFRQLHSLHELDLDGREPTVALVLRAGERGGAYVFEYSTVDCAFLPVDCDAPTERYLAVYECWATDLLDTLLVRQSQNTISFGRSRSWCAAPQRFTFTLNQELFIYVHPLRFPARFLDLYRRAIGACRAP